MKLTDEELQNKIEQGLAETSVDAQAYQHIFKILKKDPEFNLPIQFADRLVSIIEKKEEKRDYYWLAVGILFSIVSLVVAVVLVADRWSINAFSFLSSNVGLIVFGVSFVALLQWFDKKIIRKQLGVGKY
ncbi:MAG: hypothetical protein KBF45_12150 [Cyclobacteriaceae bacterium]|jgi:hypothetical protein|nr:hypothetical protein [Cyclobacteriaceae bacterium]